jgi:hypothetical protein
MMVNNEWVFGRRCVAYPKTLSGATRISINCSKDGKDVAMV